MKDRLDWILVLIREAWWEVTHSLAFLFLTALGLLIVVEFLWQLAAR